MSAHGTVKTHTHTRACALFAGPLELVPGAVLWDVKPSILLSWCCWKLMMRYWRDIIRRSVGTAPRTTSRHLQSSSTNAKHIQRLHQEMEECVGAGGDWQQTLTAAAKVHTGAVKTFSADR